jgi:hypothetical protein
MFFQSEHQFGHTRWRVFSLKADKVLPIDFDIFFLHDTKFIINLFSLPSWSSSYGSWFYSYMYLCNQCLSPLKFRVRTPFMDHDGSENKFIINLVSWRKKIVTFQRDFTLTICEFNNVEKPITLLTWNTCTRYKVY